VGSELEKILRWLPQDTPDDAALAADSSESSWSSLAPRSSASAWVAGSEAISFIFAMTFGSSASLTFKSRSAEVSIDAADMYRLAIPMIVSSSKAAIDASTIRRCLNDPTMRDSQSDARKAERFSISDWSDLAASVRAGFEAG